MESRLLAGTVEMLILKVAADAPSYGYEIVQMVTGRSKGYFELKEGSLYPALHRMERQKLLSSFWREADGRRRKYYRLTSAGQKALAAKKQEWTAFAGGINAVLGGGRPSQAGQKPRPVNPLRSSSPSRSSATAFRRSRRSWISSTRLNG